MLSVDVTNTSEVIDGVTGVVVGLDPTWVQLVLPVVSLFPEATGTLTFRFDIPPSCPAGEIPLMVRVFSTIDASIVSEHDVMLVVEPIEAAELAMRPSLVNGGTEAQMSAVITNTGNVPTEFRVEAVEPTRVLECTVNPPTVVVPPGEERAVVIIARGRRPWFGNPVNRTINVEAFSPELELATTGRFNQRPRIARGVVTALILVGIILLWAVIFLWVIDALSSKAAATKTVNKGFLDGTTVFAMEHIGGQVYGRVTAASTDLGLERITVEAFRVDQDGNRGEAAASTATAEDGTYLLESLVPGMYQVRFSAEGFKEAWCADDAGKMDLLVQPVDEDIPSVRCAVALEGDPGSLTITVDVPSGATDTATVTVQQVVPAKTTRPEPAAVTQTGPNTFVAEPLVTPAQYEVIIAFPGFEPSTSVVEVGGGDQPILDPSTLAAHRGTISGTVTDAGGQLLGNVTVTLRSGPLELKVLTPTLGAKGSFKFDNLTTPGNYVLTFELDGYSSSTISLELKPGASNTGVAARLVAGEGSITGTVSATTANGTSTLGGVVVTVTGVDFTAKTATLTGSVGNGTYSLSGLPTPGVYTVSFVAPGFISEYTTVQYVAPGQQIRNITLVQSVAQIRGTVTVAGIAKGGVYIELSDGAIVRSTTSASSPAGSFSFLDLNPGTYTLTFWTSHIVQGVVQPANATIQVKVGPGGLVQQTYDIPNGPP